MDLFIYTQPKIGWFIAKKMLCPVYTKSSVSMRLEPVDSTWIFQPQETNTPVTFVVATASTAMASITAPSASNKAGNGGGL